MATAATIGSLRAEMSANSAAFSRDMEKVRGSVNRASQSIDRNFKGINNGLGAISKGFKFAAGAAGAFGVALGVGALVRFVKTSIDAADNIAKTADRLGVTTDALQEYHFAADLAGQSSEDFDKSLELASKAIGDARAGTGTLITMLRRSDKAFLDQITSAKSTTDAFDLLLNKIAGTSNQFDKMSLARAAAGRQGAALINITKGGTAAWEANRKAARDLGLVIEEPLLRNAEKAKDALTTMEKIVSVNATRLAIQLAPAIIQISTEFTKAAPAIREAADAIADFFGVESLLSVSALDRKIAEIQKRIDDANNTALGKLRQRLNAPAQLLEGPVITGITGGASLLNRFIGIDIDALKKRLEELTALRDKTFARDEASRKILGESGDAAEQEEAAFSKVRDRLLEEFEALTKTDEERQIAIALRQADVKAGSAQADQIRDLIRATNLESAAIDELMAELDAEDKAREDAAAKAKELSESRAKAKNDLIAEIGFMQLLVDAHKKGAAAVQDERDAQELLNAAKAANIDLSSQEGQQYAENFRRLQELRKQLDGLDNSGQKASEEMRDVGFAFGDAAEDAALNGAKISDVFAKLEDDIIRIGFRAAITKPIETFFGSLFPTGPGGGGGLFGPGGFFDKTFSGFFAEGGTIRRGHWGIAGENGPEPIFAGSGDLRVLPNEAMSGGNIYVDVSAPMDPNTAQMTGWQIADAIESQLARRRR